MVDRPKHALSALDQPPTTSSVRVLETLGVHVDDDDRADLAQRTRQALYDFDFLRGATINLGRLPPWKDDPDRPYADAQPANRLVRLPVGEYTTNVTLYHELAHIAIHERHWAGHDVARTSEEYTSLYALSRMPAHRIDEDRVPYIGIPTVPRVQWPETARAALRERRDGRRAYIQRARNQLGVDGGASDG